MFGQTRPNTILKNVWKIVWNWQDPKIISSLQNYRTKILWVKQGLHAVCKNWQELLSRLIWLQCFFIWHRQATYETQHESLLHHRCVFILYLRQRWSHWTLPSETNYSFGSCLQWHCINIQYPNLYPVDRERTVNISELQGVSVL